MTTGIIEYPKIEAVSENVIGFSVFVVMNLSNVQIRMEIIIPIPKIYPVWNFPL